MGRLKITKGLIGWKLTVGVKGFIWCDSWDEAWYFANLLLKAIRISCPDCFGAGAYYAPVFFPDNHNRITCRTCKGVGTIPD